MFDKLKWQRKNRKGHRVRYSGYHREWRRKIREAVLRKLGGKCANPACQWLNPNGTRGCTDWRCLQIDHVNDDGYIERKRFASRGVTAFYRKVLADTEGLYQLLCANCNWIKKSVHDEHQEDSVNVQDTHDTK